MYFNIYCKILDSNNIQPSRSDAKGDFELKEADTNKKKGSKKTNVNKVKSINFFKANNQFYLQFYFSKVADTEGNNLKEADPNKKNGSKKPKLNNKVKSILIYF